MFSKIPAKHKANGDDIYWSARPVNLKQKGIYTEQIHNEMYNDLPNIRQRGM